MVFSKRTAHYQRFILNRLIAGSTETYEDYYIGCVHVKDVALAHILVYENPTATGRHICTESISHYGDLAAKVAELYPEYNVPRYDKYSYICTLSDAKVVHS